jgi:hypothetical protein
MKTYMRNLYLKLFPLMLLNIILQHSHAITPPASHLKPKISGFFLGEYINSNYIHKAGMSRFAQSGSFDIFCFPRAVINVQANQDDNSPINAFIGFNFRESCSYGSHNDPRSFVKFGVTDHAYLKLKSNFVMPVDIFFGIQYIPYGDYQHHRIPASFTQLLTQTQAAAVTANFFINELEVSPFILGSPRTRLNSANTVNNFGAQLKYQLKNTGTGFKIGYLYNIANSVNYIVAGFGSNSTMSNPLNSTYTHAVGGIAINIKQNFLSDYSFEAGFTSALREFAVKEINWQERGAIPKALLVKCGKRFSLWGYNHNFSINYQHSWQALNVRGKDLSFGLPKQRYQIDWLLEVYKDLEFGAHYITDLAYDSAKTTNSTFIFTVSYLFDLLANS